MSDALSKYLATEYHRRNMQVARVCGANADVDRALARAISIKGIPAWLLNYLKSAAERLPGLQHDLAAWRDLASDAPDIVRQNTDATIARLTAERDAALARMKELEARLAAITPPPDAELDALFRRACEVVHHDHDCPAIGGRGDDDCRCDAVPFLNDLKAAIRAAMEEQGKE